MKSEQTGWIEADVTINGQPLTFAESMSLRVAVVVFLQQVSNEEYRKDLGPLFADGYAANLTTVFEKILKTK